MRAHDLAGNADIRKARLSAERERRRRAAREKPFIGRQPLGRPMLAPGLDRLASAPNALAR